MLINIIIWLLFGALAGWVSWLILAFEKKESAKAYLLVGIAGALVGGFFVQLALGRELQGLFVNSFLFAVSTAVLLISLYKFTLNK